MIHLSSAWLPLTDPVCPRHSCLVESPEIASAFRPRPPILPSHFQDSLFPSSTTLLPGFQIVRLSLTIRLLAPSRYLYPADCPPGSGPATSTTASSASPLPVLLLHIWMIVCVSVSSPTLRHSPAPLSNTTCSRPVDSPCCVSLNPWPLGNTILLCLVISYTVHQEPLLKVITNVSCGCN